MFAKLQKKTRYRVAVQMDRLAKLTLGTDSTLYVIHAAARRGYELFHYEPQHLHLETVKGKRVITARGHELKFKGNDQASAYLVSEKTRNLADFDILFMRQDPPLDLAYIAATHVLEHLKDKVMIVNDPISVRNAPEKLLVTHFPELMPPTIITRDRGAIEDFRNRHGDVIFKPLFGYAGYGIFRLNKNDGNLPALLELMASLNPEAWQVQKYIPAIKTAGDKRIVLLDGEPVGCFTRIPLKGDDRGNMRVGGKPIAAKFTARDKEICRALAPVCKKQGLYLVGIDVIGDYLTEINVTSPTGLVIADRLEKRKGKTTIAEKFWDGLIK
jgi:glutathione synthase